MLLLLLTTFALASEARVAALEWRRAAPEEILAVADEQDVLRVTVALGRLRDERALATLTLLRGHDDPAVREAAAQALGYTPGGGDVLRDWLLKPQCPRAAALAALGHHAEAPSVAPLLAALAGPADEAEAAAVSLGRLGRAKVEGVESAVPALVSLVQRRRLAASAAFALFRIGLAPGAAEAPALVAAWPKVRDPSARAWLVRALWPATSPAQRAPLVSLAGGDPASVVKVALLDVVTSEDVKGAQLTGALRSPDPWVRRAAIGALGRVGDEEATRTLTGIAGGADWPAVAAIEALGAWPVEPEAPVQVRAAAVATLSDVDTLVDLALHAPEPTVRTAALQPLFALEDRAAELGARLAEAEDAMVREAAAELLGTAAEPAPSGLDELEADLAEVAHLRSARIVTSRGEIVLQLLPEVAPVAVANLARLSRDDFYDGLLFHRVVPGFVAQGGCPRGDGWGGPGWAIPDEVSLVPFDAGAVGMARSDRDTGGSQWFITLTPQPHLTGDYTLFAQVTRGMEVVRSLQRGDVILDVVVEPVP